MSEANIIDKQDVFKSQKLSEIMEEKEGSLKSSRKPGSKDDIYHSEDDVQDNEYDE